MRLFHTRALSLWAVLVLIFVVATDHAWGEQENDASAGAGVRNGGMDEQGDGTGPNAWVFVGKGGATIQLDSYNPFAGTASARIDSTQATETEGSLFSNLMQSIDATHWRGKKVCFRGAVRTRDLSPGARVQMWFRVDLKSTSGGQPSLGAFDNMQDRPIRDEKWNHHSIVLPVDKNAQRLNIGIFVIGKGQAWFDDVSLKAVDDATPETTVKIAQTPRMELPLAVMKAFAEAENAPQQPFLTHWLWLALLAIVMSVIGMSASASPHNIYSDVRPDSAPIVKVSFRFAAIYWFLYCFDNFIASIVPAVGPQIASWHMIANTWLVEWIGRDVFKLDRALVPPNGSGDTTYNYLSILALFVIAAVGALVWSLIDRRKTDYSSARDLLRSYLRYTLAFAMMGYGLAKMSVEMNQFPEISSFQLNKTWGSSSPMNVLWAFMGASRPYTIFAGTGEVVAAVLLIWRRTANLGALVALGVMMNVMVLNYCYDVPAKIYSTHLVVMCLLIILPDVERLANLLVFNRVAEPAMLSGVWQGRILWRIHLVAKTAVIGFLFVLPLGTHTWNVSRQIVNRTTTQPSRPASSDHLLTKRGFRWVNEVPFNQ